MTKSRNQKQHAAIRRARGMVKRKAGEKSLAVEWTEHKEGERHLDDWAQKRGK